MLDNLYLVKMQKRGQGNDRMMISHSLKNAFGLKALGYFTRAATLTEHCWLGLSGSESESCYHVDFSPHKSRLSGTIIEETV